MVVHVQMLPKSIASIPNVHILVFYNLSSTVDLVCHNIISHCMTGSRNLYPPSVMFRVE